MVENIICNVVKHKIKSIEELPSYENEYVYDIGVKNHPYFFGNNILVHNSCYFTVSYHKDRHPDIDWDNIDSIINYYDNIAKQVNDSFKDFMMVSFNTDEAHGNMIKSSRETVSSSAYFIIKKRYACMIIDKEGYRQDIDGKPGKLKAMGLDLKRSDTPKIIQDFLEKVLTMLLLKHSKEDIFKFIRDFRITFRKAPGWEKGSPKRVNNFTELERQMADIEKDSRSLKAIATHKGSKAPKINMSGHARASLEWNKLRSLNEDLYSTEITDGSKIIVCKLKKNPLGITSIAYPVDEVNLPDWFKELPFDDRNMEIKVITDKLENLLGVMDWNIVETEEEELPSMKTISIKEIDDDY